MNTLALITAGASVALVAPAAARAKIVPAKHPATQVYGTTAAAAQTAAG